MVNYESDCIQEENQRAMDDLVNQIYGPKYCEHCKKEQPVTVYVLRGTENFKTNGSKLNFSFTGTRVCTVCFNTVEAEHGQA